MTLPELVATPETSVDDVISEITAVDDVNVVSGNKYSGHRRDY